MQNFWNNLPNWTKVSLLALLAVAVVLGLVNSSDLNLRNGLDESIQVEFVIQDEQRQPIEGAQIQFIFDNAPEIKQTDSSGYVRIEIPQRNDVDVVITKKGFKTLSKTINLKADTERTRVYQLETEQKTSSLPITYQHYTTQNEVIPLTLHLLTPSFDNPLIEKVFAESLNSKTTPLVYSDNPVFKAVNDFKTKSGNQHITERYIKNDYDVEYTSRDLNNVTTRGIVSSNKAQELKKEVTIETEENFRKNELPFLAQGESRSALFFVYAPIKSSVNTDKIDSKYTSFYFDRKNRGIIQIPKLSDIGKSLQKDYRAIKSAGYPITSDTWIKEIIKENPEVRGFLGFYYPIFLNLDESNLLQGNEYCEAFFQNLERFTPSPYIKFIDIKNRTNSAIKIESFMYQSINKKRYELTVADRRSSLFENKTKVTEKVKNINIFLEPDKHLLVPLEFGFDTEPIKSAIEGISSSNTDNKNDLRQKFLYVYKPLSESEYLEYERLEEANSPHQAFQVLIEKINFSDEFIDNSSSLEQLSNLISKRFAVGSILNLTSVKVDGQSIEINPPNDEPSVFVSTFLLAGSCPYLVIYDSQNNSWSELGSILYGKNNKFLQGDEIYSINKNASIIKIEEREPEITYIDTLSIIYTDSTTKETREIIHPMPELQKPDKNYLALGQGELLEINLEKILPPDAANIQLKVNGYYKSGDSN